MSTKNTDTEPWDELVVYHCPKCGKPHLSMRLVRLCSDRVWPHFDEVPVVKYRRVDAPVWLISYYDRESYIPEPVGIRCSEAAMRAAVLAVVRKVHGRDLRVRIVSDATIIYVDSKIEEGVVSVSQNGTMAWTNQIVVFATQFELDGEMEV